MIAVPDHGADRLRAHGGWTPTARHST